MAAYLEYLILSMYDQPTNTGQIHNVLSGRSTPSILYLVLKKDWQHLYGLVPKISRQLVDKVHQRFLTNHLIKGMDKKFQITTAGRDLVNDFFKDNFMPDKIDTYVPYDLRQSFWQVVSFLSQVLSEKAAHNPKYAPLQKDLTSQLFVKQLIYNNQAIVEEWSSEQATIFSQMDTDLADILANTLSGHELNGLTLNQLGRLLDIQKDQVYVMRFAGIYDYMSQIQARDDLPLHRKVLNFVLTDQFYGLTSSAWDTFQLIKAGYQLDRISQIKRVKPSTIKEHILEIAFKVPQVSLTSLVPEPTQRALLDFFNHYDNWQYKYALEKMPDLEFYHYRLLELELLRHDG